MAVVIWFLSTLGTQTAPANKVHPLFQMDEDPVGIWACFPCLAVPLVGHLRTHVIFSRDTPTGLDQTGPSLQSGFINQQQHKRSRTQARRGRRPENNLTIPSEVAVAGDTAERPPVQRPGENGRTAQVDG